MCVLFPRCHPGGNPALQINKEREGEVIDRSLLKSVSGIFVEIGMGSMENYEADFENALLMHTSAYYSRKAASWIVDDPCPAYLLKVGVIMRACVCFLWMGGWMDGCVHAKRVYAPAYVRAHG